MEAILAARLEVPYWCSFRVPYTVNVHFTYPVPPITTLYGLTAAALGYPADFLEPMKELKFGIALEDEGQTVETYSRIIKWDRRFSGLRTLVMKQKLYQPVFCMYIGGSRERIEDIASALQNPAFPLFIGESDDVVEVTGVTIFPAEQVETDILECCVPTECGQVVSEGATVVHLPVGFQTGGRGKWTGVQYRDYYVANQVQLQSSVTANKVGNKRVILL
ncbi:MAG: CRISPR-associated protein Cas5 [Desulfotomaculum sp.]|nr:CRISPR-associated protein Cas5 [Desulfotomaculum sp.]